jgi:hypothetical protein
MKTLTARTASILLAVLFLFATAGDTLAQCSLSAASVLEFDRYQASHATWIVLIIPPKTSKECLVAYVRNLHRDNPDARYELFNLAAPELAQYVRAAAHDLSDDYPYPEKWLNKHHVATLLPFIGTGPSDCEWTLQFEKADSMVIGRGRCHAPAPSSDGESGHVAYRRTLT